MDYNSSSSMIHKDDDFDGYTGSMDAKNSTQMTKAELRKSNKPIMEKRRRARINHCLNELKTLILEAMKKDPARHTKLEKADILEMTVKHLQSVQRQQLSMAMQTDPTVIHKFKTGFVECAEEVNRYVTQLDNVEPSVRQRLSNHLNNCAQNIEHIGTLNSFNAGYRASSNPSIFGGAAASAAAMFPQAIPNSGPQDINNNGGRVQVGGVQLIPQRLPTGELALIMPSNNPFFLPSGVPQPPANMDFSNTFPRASAFTKPSKQQSSTSTGTAASPPLSPVSSISSLGDESSNIHASNEYLAKSPSLENINSSFTGILPTSLSYFPRNLQQQQVSSTSSEHRRSLDDLLSHKRPLAADDNSSDSYADEPSAKKRAIHHDDSGNFTENESGDEEQQRRDSKGAAWRPW